MGMGREDCSKSAGQGVRRKHVRSTSEGWACVTVFPLTKNLVARLPVPFYKQQSRAIVS